LISNDRVGAYHLGMQYVRPLLLCLVLAPACDDGSAIEPLPEPDKRVRSELAVCVDQPLLGDTWELELDARDIQRDAEGNIYLVGSSQPDCVPEDAFQGSFGLLTKVGPRGDVRWVRGWEDGVSAAVSPSGETMALAGEAQAFLVDNDGAIKEERRHGRGLSAIGASSTDFLLAGIHYGTEPISFDHATFEPTHDYGLFVIALNGDLAPRKVLQPAPAKALPVHLDAIVGLSDGDVVTAQRDDTAPLNTVITRIGARPWKGLAPLQSTTVGLFALEDDSVVVQVGQSVSRFSADGELLWSRDYAGPLHAEASASAFSRGKGGAAMRAAASGGRIVIAFVAYPSAGPLETSDGSIQPDGEDIGFATLDVETGLFERVTLETAPGDQFIVSPVLFGDGSVVARVATVRPKDAMKDAIARFRLP
jgi:hypothetical protein